MKDLFKKSGYISFLSSILFLILGILIINNPDGIVQAVSYIIGITLIVMGLFRIISYFTSRNSYVFYDYNLIYGTLCAIAGILVIVCGGIIASFFRIIIGIWIILSGVTRINLSFRAKDAGVNYWVLSLLISILILIAGIYVIFAPGAILVTVGTILVVYSIMDIIENIIFIVNMNKFFKE